MRDIIQNWLKECLRVQFAEKDIGEGLSDGVVLANLLKYYNIVNEKAVRHILPSDNPMVRQNNLHQLCVWFRLLEIHVTVDDIVSISIGKASAGLSLLYKLFVALHENIRFVNVDDSQRLNDLSSKMHPCKLLRSLHRDLLHAGEGVIEASCHSSYTSEYEKYGKEENVEEEEIKRKSVIKTCTDFTNDPSTEPNVRKGETKYDKMRREDIWFVRNQLKTTPYYDLVDKKKQLSPEYKALLASVQTINEEQWEQEQKLDLLEPNDFIQDYNTEPSRSNAEIVEETKQQQLRKYISQNILQQSHYEKELIGDKFQVTFQNEMASKIFTELTSKQSEDTKYEKFFSSCKTSEEEIASQLNAIERIELHRKLFDDKIRRRNKRRLTICQQIVRDLIEFSLKISEYGKENVTVELKLQWKQMQEIGEPLLQSTSISEKDIPTLHTKEVEISSNDHDFDDYNHLVGDWFDASGLDVSYDEQPILSYVVYRLQDCSLPKATPIEPAVVPRYMITAVLNCNFDELTTLKLATLLTKSKIRILDTKSAIQFCIDRYITEVDIKLPESKINKQSAKSNKGTNKTEKTEDSKKGSPKGKGKEVEPVIAFIDKEVQTGESLLNSTDVKTDEISKAAQLGMQLYSTDTPENIPTATIVEVLVEFLKCQKDIKGWVLVNFPSSLEEAYEVEKVLSGKSFPKVFCQNENEQVESLISKHDDEDNENKMKRSRLLQLPVREESSFQTYFTSFINATKNDSNVVTKIPDVDYEYVGYEDEENIEEEHVIDLDSIYTRQGILINFYYENINFVVLQDLARAILKVDDSVNRIPSNELFGEEVMEYYKPTAMLDKPPTAKSLKPPTSKKSAKSKDELTLAKEFLEKLLSAIKTTATDDSETTQDNLSQLEKILEEEVNVLLPGDNEWPFAELPLTEKVAITLSSSWEYLEDKYITTVKESLCEIKRHDQLVGYYENFVSKSLSQDNFQSNGSDVEIIVKKFISHFNDVLGNHRSQYEELEKLTIDILNLEMELWRISNKRRTEAETKRQELINDNWTSEEIVDISKAYLSLIQTEVVRTNSTTKILCKYYCSMCGGLLMSPDVPRINVVDYNTLCCDKSNIKSTIAKKLTNKNEINQDNPVCNYLQNIVGKYISQISQIQLQFNSVTELMKEHTLNTLENLRNEIGFESNVSSKLDEHLKSDEMNEEQMEEMAEEQDSEYKCKDLSAIFETSDHDIINLFLEWNYAIKCELDRLMWRIKIIIKKAINTLDNVEKRMTDVFHKFLTDSISAYLHENKCIDELCRLLQTALYARSQIKDDITVVNNCVNIEKTYTDVIKSHNIDKQQEGRLIDCCFTIQQLQVILEKLKCLASNGVINSRALQFIVEDMVRHDEESHYDNLFPPRWRTLTAKEFSYMWKTVFGDTNKLYWKDFLLYCLDIRFPEMEDVISYKQQFMSCDKDKNGTISYNDFMNIKMWFQDDIGGQETYYRNVKEFLFSMFKVNGNELDYNDFFLSFSKGTTSSIGFSKALAYLSGKCTIISEQSEHLMDVLVDYNDLLSKMIREILDEMIINTINDLFGVKIEEVEEEEEQKVKTQSVNTINISPMENIKKSRQEKQTKTLTEQDSHYYNEIEEEELGETEQESKSINDKESQTVSLDELMYDMYISKHKLYQWTTKVHIDTINYLLDTLVYPILEFSSNEIFSATIIKEDITDMLSQLQEDGTVSAISLMKENALQNLFQSTHMFEIFSFPSLVKKLEKHICFY